MQCDFQRGPSVSLPPLLAVSYARQNSRNALDLGDMQGSRRTSNAPVPGLNQRSVHYALYHYTVYIISICSPAGPRRPSPPPLTVETAGALPPSPAGVGWGTPGLRPLLVGPQHPGMEPTYDKRGLRRRVPHGRLSRGPIWQSAEARLPSQQHDMGEPRERARGPKPPV